MSVPDAIVRVTVKRGTTKRGMTVNNYDIIGDIHGCATKLIALLAQLGYRRDDSSVYRHPERTAVFVGDLVDRGDEQLEVLTLVKAMVDAGSAHIVMGNHEFNAIAWAMGLRPHNEKNAKQHKAFLDQLSPVEQQKYVQWFKTLPLWLELPGPIRVVHACWHEESIDVVTAASGGPRLTTDQHYIDASDKEHPLYLAVETLLKGPEINLTDYGAGPYADKDGHTRTNARIRWWDHDATTLRDLAEVRGMLDVSGEPYPELPAVTVDDGDGPTFVYTDKIPLFYGHYWRRWEPVHRDDWTTYTACVDFSAVKGGTLVAYRWNGEPEIHWANYAPHDPAVVAPTPSDQTV